MKVAFSTEPADNLWISEGRKMTKEEAVRVNGTVRQAFESAELSAFGIHGRWGSGQQDRCMEFYDGNPYVGGGAYIGDITSVTVQLDDEEGNYVADGPGWAVRVEKDGDEVLVTQSLEDCARAIVINVVATRLSLLEVTA